MPCSEDRRRPSKNSQETKNVHYTTGKRREVNELIHYKTEDDVWSMNSAHHTLPHTHKRIQNQIAMWINYGGKKD